MNTKVLEQKKTAEELAKEIEARIKLFDETYKEETEEDGLHFYKFHQTALFLLLFL